MPLSLQSTGTARADPARVVHSSGPPDAPAFDVRRIATGRRTTTPIRCLQSMVVPKQVGCVDDEADRRSPGRRVIRPRRRHACVLRWRQPVGASSSCCPPACPHRRPERALRRPTAGHRGPPSTTRRHSSVAGTCAGLCFCLPSTQFAQAGIWLAMLGWRRTSGCQRPSWCGSTSPLRFLPAIFRQETAQLVFRMSELADLCRRAGCCMRTAANAPLLAESAHSGYLRFNLRETIPKTLLPIAWFQGWSGSQIPRRPHCLEEIRVERTIHRATYSFS